MTTDRFFTNALSLGGAFAGTEQIPYDLSAGGSAFGTPAQLEAYVEPLVIAATKVALLGLRLATNQYSANTSTAGFTAAGTDIGLPCNVATAIGTVVLDLTGTLAAGANLQLPTVAALQTVLAASYTGQTYLLRVINNSSAAFAWTVTTNTGWTLTGTMTVAQNTFREFLVTVSNAGSHTATLQNIGSGTN